MKLRFLQKPEGQKILQYSEGETQAYKDVPLVKEEDILDKIQQAYFHYIGNPESIMLGKLDFIAFKGAVQEKSLFPAFRDQQVAYNGIPVLEHPIKTSGIYFVKRV